MLDKRFAALSGPIKKARQGEYTIIYHDMLIYSGAASEVSDNTMLPNLNLVIIENNYKIYEIHMMRQTRKLTAGEIQCS